jgi:excisionase family DNA binding protein
MENAVALSIAEACMRSGIGRTAMCQMINSGQLPARKCGRRTLILADDLFRTLESLPLIKEKSKRSSKQEVV